MPCMKPFQITRPSLTSSENCVMSYNEMPHRLSPIAISHRASTLPISRDTTNIDIIVPMPRGAMGWDADTAIQAGHRIDEFDPYWLEEPVMAEDFAGYRRIAAALKTRIVGGESHFTRNDLRPFFEAPHPVPILQPDPMRGGYTELRKIAAAAEPWGIRIAPHLFHDPARPSLVDQDLCRPFDRGQVERALPH